MSSGFGLVLIAGIAMFATGGRLALPLMGIGAVGLAVSAFWPARRTQMRVRDLDEAVR